jgi:hypothetical protein
MINPADYFFYRILKWRETREPVDRMPLLTTKAVVALTFFCNILAIMYGLSPFTPPLPLSAPTFSFALGAIIFSAVHLGWVTTGRYRTLDKKFAAENQTQRTMRTRLLYGYVVLSILTLLVVAGVVAPALRGW